MAMIIIDERLADILDDGNARRGWWMDLKREEDISRIRLIECAMIYDHSNELESIAA